MSAGLLVAGLIHVIVADRQAWVLACWLLSWHIPQEQGGRHGCWSAGCSPATTVTLNCRYCAWRLQPWSLQQVSCQLLSQYFIWMPQEDLMSYFFVHARTPLKPLEEEANTPDDSKINQKKQRIRLTRLHANPNPCLIYVDLIVKYSISLNPNLSYL